MLTSKNICILVLLGLIYTNSYAQNYLHIQGYIVDSKTKAPLEYASIGLTTQHIGTISNSKGEFYLYIPDSLSSDTIQINYLGYESFKIQANKLRNKGNKIKLKAIPTEIGEVVVRPLTPYEVIERAIENYDSNYARTPFVAKGFYLQEIIENDKYIDFIEAFVDIYTPPFFDTNDCQARLIQGRTRDDLGDIQFMRRFTEDKLEKKIRKAERKGDTIDSTSNDGVQILFGGPQNITSDDFIRQFSKIYDKKAIKKFDCTFENNSYIGGRELYVIRCISRRPYNHLVIDGHLYIDKKSFALVKIKADMTVDIPALAKPILRLYRIKINELNMESDVEYTYHNGKWYPKKNIMAAYIDLRKRYKGKYTEHSILKIRNAFVTTDIDNTNITPFKEEELISEAPLAEQLGNYDPEFWKNRNKIEYHVGH